VNGLIVAGGTAVANIYVVIAETDVDARIVAMAILSLPSAYSSDVSPMAVLREPDVFLNIAAKTDGGIIRAG